MVTAAELNAALARSNEIQQSVWQNAMALAAKDSGMVPTGLFIQSLNEMIDNSGKTSRCAPQPCAEHRFYRSLRRRRRLAGYANGLLEKRRVRLPVYFMGVLVSAVILLIQDLDRPTAGFIRVSQQPMIDTAAAIAAYPD